jgi:hypothetical protein
MLFSIIEDVLAIIGLLVLMAFVWVYFVARRISKGPR